MDPIREKNWKTFLKVRIGENHSNMNLMNLGCCKMSLEAVILVEGATLSWCLQGAVGSVQFIYSYCKYVNDFTKTILLKM